MSRAQPNTHPPASPQRHMKPKGRGVFACRVCGTPIPPTFAWVTARMTMAAVWEAGYCSREHWNAGRRAGWSDDLAEWNRERDRQATR